MTQLEHVHSRACENAAIYDAMVPLGPRVAVVRAAFIGRYEEYVGPELDALRAVAPEFGYSGDPAFSAAWCDGKRPCTVVCVLDGVIGFAFQEIPLTSELSCEQMEVRLREQVRGILEAKRKGGWPRFKKRRKA